MNNICKINSIKINEEDNRIIYKNDTDYKIKKV